MADEGTRCSRINEPITWVYIILSFSFCMLAWIGRDSRVCEIVEMIDGCFERFLRDFLKWNEREIRGRVKRRKGRVFIDIIDIMI